MKLRHIALSVQDVPKAQKFFEEAFGMTKAGNAQNGVYMTDGTMNVALLNKNGIVDGVKSDEPFFGVMHFGMWVDDLEKAHEQVTKAGAVHHQGKPPDRPNSYYEVKYRDPTGIIFDITASGWVGAVKNVRPAD